MKLHLRWQILLALLALGLAWSLFTVPTAPAEPPPDNLPIIVPEGGSCIGRVPEAGGIFTEGVLGGPQYLNPLLSDANPVDRQLVDLLFDGLLQVGADGQLQPALAETWTVAEDGRTLQFSLRQDVRWHDGEPFTAVDVLFTYGLMQQPDFPGEAALKTLWQSVEISQIDEYTVQFVLAEPYAPFLEATTRGILPAHLLQTVTAAELLQHPFNQAPIGTGPWQMVPDQNWVQSHHLQLTPNPERWPQTSQIPILAFQFYADEATMLQDLSAGNLQALSQLSAELLPDIATLEDVRLFTAVAPRLSTLLFNLSPSTAPTMQSLEMRQALAYALDRQALIDQVLVGQGVPLEGPYLPNSWAYNANQLTPYNYDPITATARLDNLGWLLPQGQTVRQQDALPLTIRLLTLQASPYRDMAEAIAQQWRAVQADVVVTAVASLAELQAVLAAGEFDVALVDITPMSDPDLYDFWSQEAMVRGQNYAQWNNRRASEALEAGRQAWNIDQRRPYYDAFLGIFNSNLPALTLYQHVQSYVLSETVYNAEVGYLHRPRDRYTDFADWFVLYRDVAIECE